MSVHTDSAMFRWLVPARGLGPAVHLVDRDKLRAAAREGSRRLPLGLCGARPTITDRGTPTWRKVSQVGVKICNACHAESCAKPSRIEWG